MAQAEVEIVEIVVEADSPRESEALANNLLARLGGTAQTFTTRRVKEDKATQSLGAILLIVGPIVGQMAGSFLNEAAKEMARELASWMRKNRRTVALGDKDEPKQQSVGPDEAERLILEHLRRKYPEIAKAEAEQQAAENTKDSP